MTLGQRQETRSSSQQGVTAGERVVVIGQLGVTPGGKVRELPAEARSDAGRRRRRQAMNFSEPFIRRPVMTAVLTVSVVLFGVLAYLKLPVNDLPAVDYPVIQVQAAYPGASPETVATNIATPLERQFMQINGLELVTSKSTRGTRASRSSSRSRRASTRPPPTCRRPSRRPRAACRPTCPRRRPSPRPIRTTSRSCTSR